MWFCWYDLTSCFEGQWRGSREQLEELGVVLISMPLMCTSSFFALVSHERGFIWCLILFFLQTAEFQSS